MKFILQILLSVFTIFFTNISEAVSCETLNTYEVTRPVFSQANSKSQEAFVSFEDTVNKSCKKEKVVVTCSERVTGKEANVAKGGRTLNYTGSSGAKSLVANSNKTTTILGRWADDMQYIKPLMTAEDFNVGTALGKVAENKGGFNFLDIPTNLYEQAGSGFFEMYNKPWLKAAVERGDDIVLATKPINKGDFIIGGILQGNYAKELNYLVTKVHKPINLTDTEWQIIIKWFE